MFENCTKVKYNKYDGKNCSIQVEWPVNPDGNIPTIVVPLSEGNTDYQNILAWVAEGNTIEPADEE